MFGCVTLARMSADVGFELMSGKLGHVVVALNEFSALNSTCIRVLVGMSLGLQLRQGCWTSSA